MKVLVVGANGQIGKKIVRKLSTNNHQVLAMVRDTSQVSDMQELGAKAVVADLEKDISHAFEDHLDAVIFSAGSGGNTGKDKTLAVDLQGAKKSIDEAVKHNVSRFIMISALGTNNANEAPDNIRHYFMAKSEADQYLVQSELDYTILRPGRLTDESGTGSVNAAEKLEEHGDRTITRDDVATTALYVLDQANTHKKVIELLQGKVPVKDAISTI